MTTGCTWAFLWPRFFSFICLRRTTTRMIAQMRTMVEPKINQISMPRAVEPSSSSKTMSGKRAVGSFDGSGVGSGVGRAEGK